MPKYIEDSPNKYHYDTSINPPCFAEDRINFEYIILLRVYLEQLNPPDGKQKFNAPDHDGTLVPSLRWNDAAWHHFTTLYIQRVLEIWDSAFLLTPPKSYDGFQWPDGGDRRNLLCRIRIKLVDSASTAHATIRVVRLANPSAKRFRSDSELYDSGDVDLTRSRFHPAGMTFLHNIPAHEVGHLLGLWHSGEGDSRCKSEEENSACYGTNLHDRMNIMGAGSMLDLEDAIPWMNRLPKHVPNTRIADWKVDFASSEAALRGLKGSEVDEDRKEQSPRLAPGQIDL